MPKMNHILAIILGGGVGTRLYPLTKLRSKPAVPIAGKYRLIDIPISNCINSNIQHIAILTQFNSVSLHRHITYTYNFDVFHQGGVEILAAEQTPQSTDWYQGTADAVRKQLFEIKASGAKFVLILAGDHLYRMNYELMAEFHWENKADITVAVHPVSQAECSRFGILKRDPDFRISNFVEKPKDKRIQEKFVSLDNPDFPFLGSMGIYLFNTNILEEVLESSLQTDFGGEIIPEALSSHAVYGFSFDGYWEDIGTIHSFYETNLRLTKPDCPFNFYDPVSPIYTHPRFLPGSVINGATLQNVLLSDGCQIQKANISNSVIGLRSQVADGVRIKATILMGADYYDSQERSQGRIQIGVGQNCDIEGAIIDKNVRIGEGVQIKPFPIDLEADTDNWVVKDGIVVIPKSTTLNPGTIISP